MEVTESKASPYSRRQIKYRKKQEKSGKKYFGFFMNAKDLRIAKKQAKIEGKSFAGLIRWLLSRHLDEKGLSIDNPTNK